MSSDLPDLRQDLELVEGPDALDGSPTWTLYDPAGNQFFSLGWHQALMLEYWRLAVPESVAQAVTEASGSPVTSDDVQGFAKFLFDKNLTDMGTEAGIRWLGQQKQAQKSGSWAAGALKNYLFLKIPLVRPDGFLQWLASRSSFLFSKAFLIATVVTAAVTLLAIFRQWHEFSSQFSYAFSAQGLLLYGLAIFLSKVVHELAHGVTARRFGCQVPVMGVAFLVLWPVLYTDVSDTWRLKSRSQRLAIGAAGMLAELSLAVYSSVFWLILPDGVLRGALFVLATTTWIITLFVNLNPLMRFDGYFLLSDFWRVPNLQERAFEFGRWRLRRLLFAAETEAPEVLPKGLQRRLIIYAWATWIYRFFLFLAIAVLVYHLFFKLLGILLMVVEVWWFILRPIAREVKAWFAMPSKVSKFRTAVVVALFLTFVGGGLFYPWQDRISAPALYTSAKSSELVTKSGGRVEMLAAEVGHRVTKGQPLVSLSSDDLAYKIRHHQLEKDYLSWLLAAQSVNEDLIANRAVTEETLLENQSALQALSEEVDGLVLRAPFDGEVSEIAQEIREDQWIGQGQVVMEIIDRQPLLVAYVAEDALARVEIGAPAKFIPSGSGLQSVSALVSRIGSSDTAFLRQPIWHSDQGGPIPVRTTKKGVEPIDQIFRVELQPRESVEPAEFQQLGVVWIDAPRRNLLERLWNWGRVIALRELSVW